MITRRRHRRGHPSIGFRSRTSTSHAAGQHRNSARQLANAWLAPAPGADAPRWLSPADWDVLIRRRLVVSMWKPWCRRGRRPRHPCGRCSLHQLSCPPWRFPPAASQAICKKCLRIPPSARMQEMVDEGAVRNECFPVAGPRPLCIPTKPRQHALLLHLCRLRLLAVHFRVRRRREEGCR
jgi:hypothetical protein